MRAEKRRKNEGERAKMLENTEKVRERKEMKHGNITENSGRTET